MARLIETEGKRLGAEYPLAEKTALGRGSSNDIVMDETKASRNHAVIIRRQGEYVIADFDSKNGTYVNGRRYKVKHLWAGDVIRIGQTLFEFYLTEDDPPSQRRRLGVSVIEDESVDPSGLATFHVGRLVMDEDGLEVESSAVAQIKIGPALRAARELDSAGSEDELCMAMANGISALFEHIDRCAILFVDRERTNLFPWLTLNHTDDADDIVIPLSVIRPAFAEGVAVLARDAVKDLGYTEESGADLLKTMSFAAAPILTKEECFGVIYADTITRGFYFTDEDLHLMVLAGVLGAEKLSGLGRATRVG